MVPRKWGRVFVFILFTIVALQLGFSYISSPEMIGEAGGVVTQGEKVAPAAEGITVITSRGLQSGANRNMLVAIDSDGRVLYSDNSFHNYYDVDPTDRGKYTVLLLAQEEVTTGKCSEGTQGDKCLRNVVLYLNLTTGEQTRVFSRLRPGGNPRDADWHDVDYIGDNRYLVGDIQNNRVYILNVSTGEEEWSWSAQADYDVEETGGPYPDAWTHLNDVEYLSDGRVMVSLRNQDQVVFLRPGEGLLDNTSLGEPDNHSILFEQHNPDFIPVSEGGPAVLVSDSENNRIVEYQWTNGNWNRTWQWTDSRMQWPRDADRLPNNHTLIVDSNGNRVFEIDQDGEIVWQVNVSTAYDAERLSTGDESDGGHSAESANLSSNGPVSPNEDSSGIKALIRSGIDGFIPKTIQNGIFFIAPSWFGLYDYLAVGALFGILLFWIPYEAYRSPYGVRFPVYKRES